MTRDNLAAGCLATRRIIVAAGMLSCLALAGCGGGAATDGADLTGLAPQNQPKVASVAFAPIIGAPQALGLKMTDALTAAAKEKSIPVAGAGEADYSIMGLMQAGRETAGSRLTYIGDIADKSGKRLKRVQVDEIVSPKKSGDPWALIDDASMQRVATRAAGEIHAYLTGAKPAEAPALTASAPASAAPRPPVTSTASITPTAAPAPAAAPRPAAQPVRAFAPPAAAPADMTVFVAPVVGAPGDGAVSLTAAMKRSLAAQGLKVADARSPNGYTVRGNVEMGAAADGAQPIVITWQVLDASGKPLTNAVKQRNNVDAGSLDGAWGPIADAAASAASVEVAKIVPRPTT
ncbi:MAG: hypothetical protein NW215_04765 [Hyphomicrobiales bacterium]|nr:hypothetical protein [Hyphomicrobiales bacterium]